MKLPSIAGIAFSLLLLPIAYGEDLAQPCKDLYSALKKCTPYACSFYAADNEGLISYKQVLGRLPTGCKYVEFTPRRTVDCLFPYRVNYQKFRFHLNNQEDASVFDMVNFDHYAEQYCKSTWLVSSAPENSAYVALQHMIQNIKSNTSQSLLLEQKQASAILSALAERDYRISTARSGLVIYADE